MSFHTTSYEKNNIYRFTLRAELCKMIIVKACDAVRAKVMPTHDCSSREWLNDNNCVSLLESDMMRMTGSEWKVRKGTNAGYIVRNTSVSHGRGCIFLGACNDFEDWNDSVMWVREVDETDCMILYWLKFRREATTVLLPKDRCVFYYGTDEWRVHRGHEFRGLKLKV